MGKSKRNREKDKRSHAYYSDDYIGNSKRKTKKSNKSCSSKTNDSYERPFIDWDFL